MRERYSTIFPLDQGSFRITTTTGDGDLTAALTQAFKVTRGPIPHQELCLLSFAMHIGSHAHVLPRHFHRRDEIATPCIVPLTGKAHAPGQSSQSFPILKPLSTSSSVEGFCGVTP